MSAISGGPLWVENFYKKQLVMMRMRGLGNTTIETGVVITPALIEITKKRMKELEFKRINSLKGHRGKY